MTRTLALAALVLATIAPTAARAAGNDYTSESAWDAVIGSGALSVQDFEHAPTSSTATSLTWGDATFSCSGTTYCPGFFGTRSFAGGTDGPTTVYGATPDTLTFTFSHAITAFGVDVIGLGTVGATNVTVTLSDGSSQVVLSDYVNSGAQFVGVQDAAGFTSVTFSGSTPNDGIDFDRLQTLSAVPEPGSLALMLAGLGAIGVTARRRTRKA